MNRMPHFPFRSRRLPRRTAASLAGMLAVSALALGGAVTALPADAATTPMTREAIGTSVKGRTIWAYHRTAPPPAPPSG
jgi:hypothetical protein